MIESQIVDYLTEFRKSLNKENISFVQIGASDGIVYDYANIILKNTDEGYFIEPLPIAFSSLLENKKSFKKCKFLKFALLPNQLSHVSKMNLIDQEFSQGASVLNGLQSSSRTISLIDVETMSVQKFIFDNNIKEIDMLFCDTEGLDHLLILSFLKYIKPKILFFESFFMFNTEKILYTHTNEEVKIPSTLEVLEILKNEGYNTISLRSQENIIAVLNNK